MASREKKVLNNLSGLDNFLPPENIESVLIQHPNRLKNDKYQKIVIHDISFYRKKASEFSNSDWVGKIKLANSNIDDFYFIKEEVTTKIESHIDQRENLILVGDHYSGKSKIISKIITNKYYDHEVYLFEINKSIVEKGTANSFINELKIRSLLKNGNALSFVVFDNLQNYLELKQFSILFEELLFSENIIIISTCTTDEFEKNKQLFKLFLENPFLRLNKVNIGPLKESEVKSIKKALTERKIPFNEFDNTVDQLFSNLSTLKKQYTNLKNDSIEKEILWCLKCLHFLTGHSQFPNELVHHFLTLSLNLKDENLNNFDNKYEQAKKHLADISLIDVDQKKNYINTEIHFLNELVSRGFLHYLEDNNYLTRNEEQIEVEGYMTMYILSTYSFLARTEMESLYHTIIKRSSNEESRISILEKSINENYPLSTEVINILIATSENTKRANNWYDHLLKKGLTPNLKSFHAIAPFCKNDNQLYLKWQDIQRSSVRPNRLTLKILLLKTENFTTAWSIYQEFSKRDISLSLKSDYYLMLGKSTSFEEGWMVYKEATKNKILLRPIFYENLLRKEGGNFEQSFKIYNKLKTLNPNEINSFVIENLMNSATKIGNTEIVFQEATNLNIEGLSPDFYKRLIKLSPTFNDGMKYIEIMERDIGMPDTPAPYNELMLKEEIIGNEIKILYERLLEESNIDIETVNTYIKSPEIKFDLAYKEYENALNIGIHPNLETFNLLLGKVRGSSAEKAQLAKDLLLDIQGTIEENELDEFKVTLFLLADLLSEIKSKCDLITFARQIGVKIDESYFAHLAKSCNSSYEIFLVCNEIYKTKRTPSIQIAFTLLDQITENSTFEMADLVLLFNDLKSCGVNDYALSNLFSTLLIKEDKVDVIELYHQLDKITFEFQIEEILSLIWLEIRKTIHQSDSLKPSEIINKYLGAGKLKSEHLELLFAKCSQHHYAKYLWDNTYNLGIEMSEKVFTTMLNHAMAVGSQDAIRKVFKNANDSNPSYIISLLEILAKRPKHSQLLIELHDYYFELISKEDNMVTKKVFWYKTKEENTPSLIKEDNVTQISYFFANHIGRQSHFAEAINSFNKLVSSGLKPNYKVFENLLWLVDTPNQAEIVFEKLNEHNIWNSKIATLLIKNSDAISANKYFEAFEKHTKSIESDSTEYQQAVGYLTYCYLKKLETFDLAYLAYKKAIEANQGYTSTISPFLLESLAEKIDSSKAATIFLEEFDKLGENFTENMLDSLIEKQEINKVWDIFENSKYNNYFPKLTTYHKIKKLSENDNQPDDAQLKKMLKDLENLERFSKIAKLMLALNPGTKSFIIDLALKSTISVNEFVNLFILFEDIGAPMNTNKVYHKIKIARGDKRLKLLPKNYAKMLKFTSSFVSAKGIFKDLLVVGKFSRVDPEYLTPLIVKEVDYMIASKYTDLIIDCQTNIPSLELSEKMLDLLVPKINSREQANHFWKTYGSLSNVKKISISSFKKLIENCDDFESVITCIQKRRKEQPSLDLNELQLVMYQRRKSV